MITQQQLLSSLLTHPPMKAGAVGLILQIRCWSHFVMAQELFCTKKKFYKIERRLLPMSYECCGLLDLDWHTCSVSRCCTFQS